jgi:hypothetical protein
MKLTQRLTAGALTLVLSAGLFAMPLAAQADRRDRNGNNGLGIGLGAAAAALLLGQRDKTAGIIVGAGVLLAATRNNKDRYGDRYYNDRDYRYDDRYNRGRYNDRYNDDRYNRDYHYDSDRNYRNNDRYDRDDRSNRDRGNNYDNYDRNNRNHRR